MAITVNDDFRVNAPKPVDQRYGPYNTIIEATTNIPLYERHLGLTVGIISSGQIKEYWWDQGLTNSDLILKTVASGNNSFSGLTGFPSDNINLNTVLIAKADLVNGKVKPSQLPDSIVTGLIFKGFYNLPANVITSSDIAINNTPLPPASSTTGSTYNQGWFFVITSGGTYSGVTYAKGDYIVSLGSSGWDKIDNSESILTTDDLQEGVINLYFTNTKAKIAVFNSTNFIGSEGILTSVLSGASVTIKTKFASTIDDNLGSIAVGGIPANTLASSLKTLNLVQVFENMLFPDQLPTYTIPTIGLSLLSGTTGYKEVGSNIPLTVQLMGVKNEAGPFTSLKIYKNNVLKTTTSISTMSAAPIPNQLGYASPNNPNYAYSVLFAETLIPTFGSTIYSGKGDYDVGLPKKNNKNVIDIRPSLIRSINSPQAAAVGFTSNTLLINGIYPIFYGTNTNVPTSTSISTLIQGGNTNKLLIDSDGTINIGFGAGGQYLWFAIPVTSTSKSIWYVTSMNTGNIGGGSNLFGTEIIQNVSSPDGYWSNLNYKVYISNYPTTTSGSMELRN